MYWVLVCARISLNSVLYLCSSLVFFPMYCLHLILSVPAYFSFGLRRLAGPVQVTAASRRAANVPIHRLVEAVNTESDPIQNIGELFQIMGCDGQTVGDDSSDQTKTFSVGDELWQKRAKRGFNRTASPSRRP